MQSKVLAEYFANKLDPEIANELYGLDYNSVALFVIQDANEKIAIHSNETIRNSFVERAKSFLGNLYVDIAIKVSLLFVLFVSCKFIPDFVAYHTDPLTALNVQKAGIAAFIYTFAKVFFEVFCWLIDRKEWEYSTTFYKSEKSYDSDTEQLTPYQRCQLSFQKRCVRLFFFCLLFWAVMSV